MSTKYFIAFDLGATSGRTILGELDDGQLRIKEISRFTNNILPIGGKYYWNIYALYEHICEGLRAAAQEHVEITSIGIDTWGVDFVCVAEDGSLLSLPRAYRDPYTKEVTAAFFRHMSEREVYKRTGIQIMNFNTLYQLYATQAENSTALKCAKSILFMPDALAYLLTGKQVCEYTILSTAQIMNPRTRQIDEDLLQIAGIDKSLFPRIVLPGEHIGLLSEEIAQSTGLARIPVVAVASHDTGSAVAAVPALNKGFAYLSSGTWSLMGVELAEPIINDTSYALNFTNEGGVDGTIRFLKNITGMWLLEQCRVAWALENRKYTYKEVMDITRMTPRSTFQIDPDAPEFAAPANMPLAIKDYCQAHGFPSPENDGAMMRLIFDSLATKYAIVLNKLRALAPFNIKCLHVIGGGAQNELLNQMTADAISMPVIAGPIEATAIGNIMIQAKASGIIGSLAQMRECIHRSIQTTTYQPKYNHEK